MKRILLACITLSCITATSRADKLRVTADNVNLRASSNLSSRVMGQVAAGTILESVSNAGDWVSVLPPKNVVLWIHSDLVADNKVKVSKANLRSGPGINYERMLSVTRDTELDIMGSFGNWTKIAPPPGATVWISTEFTESVTAPSPVHSTLPAQPSATDIEPGEDIHVGIAAKPPKPVGRGESPLAYKPTGSTSDQPLTASGITTNMLVASEAQGQQVSRRGILKRASVAWRRPSRYLLIPSSSATDDQAICYVAGNDPQLESVLGKTMTVEGKQYIVQGARFPVLTATRITLH